MQINAARLEQRLLTLAQIGATPEGGVNRWAFTPEDRQATDLVMGWMREAGLQVRQDAGGNVFARKPGRREGPRVLAGSHLDSVPQGGRYDGPAGVLSALEALQTLVENGIETELPLEACVFVNEEGSRFAGGLLGSSLLGGQFDPADLDRLHDPEGVSLREAMAAFGADPSRVETCKAQPGELAAYFEVHIEQAKVLEDKGLPVGIVSGIAGIAQFRITIRGRAEHAGATPMAYRHDPLVGAALVVQEIERAAREAGPSSRATVGFITARPGGANVIPSDVTFSLDIRDTDADQRARVIQRIHTYLETVCADRGLRYEWQQAVMTPPVVLPDRMVGLLKETAVEQGHEPFMLVSGAAHDGMNLAELCPVGMIFLRSREGLSHNPAEFTAAADLAAGAQLLLGALVKAANGALG